MRQVFFDQRSRLRSGWVIAGYAVIVLVAFIILNVIASLLHLDPREMSLDEPKLFTSSVIMLLAATAGTIPAVLLGEFVGLSTPPVGRWWLLGLGAGAVLITLTVCIPAAGGHQSLAFSGLPITTIVAGGLQQLVTIGPTSVGEEILLRGVPLWALVRGTHKVVAVFLTGALFGVLHLTNPNASLVAALNVALVGFWFGALAYRSRSLWLPVGAHVAWNWFEGFFWGQPVSGLSPGRALFTGPPPELGFFGGGAFGPEASGFTSVLLVLATLATVFWPKPKPKALEPLSVSAADGV